MKWLSSVKRPPSVSLENGSGETASSSLTIALAGNPNVGKSTVFNALTGLHQHTGNWPGKTVELKSGSFVHRGRRITLVDVPGTYSLDAHSAEEEVTRDYLLSGRADGVIVVCDGCLLERNLLFALQVRRVCPQMVLCVNLMDEAKKKGISVDCGCLSEKLGCPVIPCAARQNVRRNQGLTALKETVAAWHGSAVSEKEEAATDVVPDAGFPFCGCGFGCYGCPFCREAKGAGEVLENQETAKRKDPLAPSESEPCSTPTDEAEAGFSEAHRDATLDSDGGDAETAHAIAAACVRFTGDPMRRDRLLDRIFTGKLTAYPVMALLLLLVFYLTISGAGVLSEGLSAALSLLKGGLDAFLASFLPPWLVSLLSDGVLGTTFTVIAVMLPPMAIFFPLFTLLEDSGYLPRAAYNIDRCFQACGSCGKQSLTMMMGFGCNAAGVTGCRIIDSPRERMIAILTNAFVPCNGRFPILLSFVALLGTSFHWSGGPLFSAFAMALLIILSTAVTLLVSKLLAVTLLRGEPSAFTLELPPYRRPRIGQTLVRSLLDRTAFVLMRAVSAAAPAGALLWLAVSVKVGEGNLLTAAAGLLEPIGHAAGMDGVLLCAFLCALPAAEIMLPLAVMGYAGGNALLLGESASAAVLFAENGWTVETVVCVILFTLFHFPCATTLLTIRRETGSIRWTVLAAVLPTVVGYGLCALVHGLFAVFG